jgi:hypothetical protein
VLEGMTVLIKAARLGQVAAPAGVAAGVAELADALDLGSSDVNRGGSNPPARTTALRHAERSMLVRVVGSCRWVAGNKGERALCK